MSALKVMSSRQLRTLLVVGRVSNLPTVWSNCLAGWLLAGGGSWMRFGLLCLGASSLYLGGMFLNDAMDQEYDARYRKERPIPSGLISIGEVWGWGLGWLLAGGLVLGLLGPATAILTLLLIGCVLLYDAVHKHVPFAPVLMGACRFMLYLVAASAAVKGVTGLAIWSGLALGVYVTGLSYFAARENTRRPVARWPSILLAAPILLAWIANAGSYQLRAILLSALMGVWILRCLRGTFWGETVNVGWTVGGLLAGICLVDMLAMAGGTFFSGIMFVFFFLLALILQRVVPAT
jgi:heme O synthase-like polyprenyltransferase